MNLLKLGPVLERFAAPTGETTITLERDRCVRAWNHAGDCRLCADGCPTTAIRLDAGSVVFDATTCVECGFCSHACPTGAFTGSDETAKVLKSAASLAPCAALDLTCSHFPTQQAHRDVDAILQVGGCLAALGAASYVGLAALGVKRVGVHVEACTSCPIGTLRTQITGVAGEAATLTAMSIHVLDVAPEDRMRKSVYATRSPQYSRRGLLRRVVGSKPAHPRALPPLEDPPPVQKHPPLERRMLLHVLASLSDEQRTSTAYFPSFTVSTTCTACKVCATVCPTGALSFEPDDNVFSLRFAPLACTDCGLCTQLCAPGALRPGSSVQYADAHPILLLSGQQKQCKRCRASFTGAGDLCPACAFRRQNPFGSLPRPRP